jgi:hypothetical protein
VSGGCGRLQAATTMSTRSDRVERMEGEDTVIRRHDAMLYVAS